MKRADGHKKILIIGTLFKNILKETIFMATMICQQRDIEIFVSISVESLKMFLCSRLRIVR